MFLGDLAQLRTATVIFVTSVCPSVHIYRRGSHWMEYIKSDPGGSKCNENRTKISGTSDNDLTRLFCCPRYKFAITAFLCNSQFCYIYDSEMYLKQYT
jgi:hypothetical protein